MGDESIGLVRQNPGFLGFGADIHFDETGNTPVLPLHFLGQSGGEFGPVEGFDHVEQRHRLFDLVGLEGADEMQGQVWETGLKGGKFPLRLLHPVLAENPLAGGKRRLDRGGGVGFRNSNELDGGRIAAGTPRGGGHARFQRGKIGGNRGDIVHGRWHDGACRWGQGQAQSDARMLPGLSGFAKTCGVKDLPHFRQCRCRMRRD